MELVENASKFLPLEITIVNKNHLYELNLLILKSEKYWKITGFFF